MTIKYCLLVFFLLKICTAKIAIRVDVGGTMFKTTLFTLTKMDGTLKTLVESIESGDTGPIFIDRSPEHFDLILNYLRDEEVNLPESEEDVREILKEAEYYSLDDLVEQCKSKLPQDPSYTLKFLENDMDLLQITTTPEKAVIVFYYPVTVHGKVRWPEDLEVKSFLDKYDDEYEIYFKRAQMTRADREEWMWSIHKGDDRVDFKYHRHNFPKQSFITLFEDSVKAF